MRSRLVFSDIDAIRLRSIFNGPIDIRIKSPVLPDRIQVIFQAAFLDIAAGDKSVEEVFRELCPEDQEIAGPIICDDCKWVIGPTTRSPLDLPVADIVERITKFVTMTMLENINYVRVDSPGFDLSCSPYAKTVASSMREI